MTITDVQRRWQRRYSGRRYVLGVPVDREPIGTMVDACVGLDIATRQLVHAFRPGLYAILRLVARLLPKEGITR